MMPHSERGQMSLCRRVVAWGRQVSRRSSTGSGLSQFGGVHGSSPVGGRSSAGGAKIWRNKPLLRREGDKIFKTGGEAVQLLNGEALRKDSDCLEFIASWESVTGSLNVVFDRMPKYAWIMKQLLEPERTIIFRVAWIDDSGISRINRGYRVQYSSTLGPYVGGTSFSPRVNMSTMKAAAFDTALTNALSHQKIGGAYGGADFNPYDKSETEIQRFCQSYMTELSKYIGPDVDLPGLGEGVNASEIGFLYGQYKRVNQHCGQVGKGLLWGGVPVYQQAQGYGVVHFAEQVNTSVCDAHLCATVALLLYYPSPYPSPSLPSAQMLADKGMSLAGKKCLITGSHATAMAVAEKLLELGAVPITFTDSSGHIYEPSGFDAAKLKTVMKIKDERGARVGRYIIASTSAKFNEFSNVYDIPCDYAFPCSTNMQLGASNLQKLADNGCKAIVEGVQQAMRCVEY